MSSKDITHVKPAYVVRGALDYKAAERPQGLCLDSDDDSVYVEMRSNSNWTDVLTIETINDRALRQQLEEHPLLLRPIWSAHARSVAANRTALEPWFVHRLPCAAHRTFARCYIERSMFVGAQLHARK